MAQFEIRIKDRYRLQFKLGDGGYGDVYQALDLSTGEQVAVKIDTRHRDVDTSLSNEQYTYERLAGGTGIPRVHWHGREDEHNVMVLDLLGPSLHDLLDFCGGKFSLKTVLLLADQLIRRLQYIHSKGFIHRDLKPSNLLMGRIKQGNLIYVVDMGTATEYRRAKDGPDDGLLDTNGCLGTVSYSSINGHSGHEQSPRDDMEALGYVLVRFLRGWLPWDKQRYLVEHRYEEMLNKKKAISIEKLCEGLPEEFVMYIEQVRSLRFKEKPNYGRLLRQFSQLFARNGFEYDHVYDWTELKFLMSRQGTSPKSVTEA